MAGVSAIAFMGGLVFISYDDSVTPLVSEKIEAPIGKYIAQEIVKRINAHGGLTYIHLRGQALELALPGSTMPAPHG